MAPSTHSVDVSQIQTDTTAILVDTSTTIPATIATVDGNVDAILVDTGTTIPATISTVDGNVDAILVDTGTTIPATITTIQDDRVHAVWSDASDTAATSAAWVDKHNAAVTLPAGNWYLICYGNWYGTTAADVIEIQLLLNGSSVGSLLAEVRAASAGQFYTVQGGVITDGQDAQLRFKRNSGSGTVRLTGVTTIAYPV